MRYRLIVWDNGDSKLWGTYDSLDRARDSVQHAMDVTRYSDGARIEAYDDEGRCVMVDYLREAEHGNIQS